MISAPARVLRLPSLTAASLAACLVFSGSAWAQQAGRLLPTPVDVTPLLQSSDPIRQAWGAWIAGRDRIDGAQPQLEQVVASAVDAEPYSAPVDFALDALIELGAELPPDLLARVAERRPTEGLILLANVDDGTVDAVLLSRLGGERGYEWFAAANLLFFRRPPGYAAQLLAGLRLGVQVTISDDGSTISSGGLSGSIGCGVFQSTPGMPPWPSYELTTSAAPGFRVLATGPTPIYYERRVSAAGSGRGGSGGSGEGPSGADRLRYVAALTGRTPDLLDDEHRSVKRRPGLQVAALEASVRADVTRRHAGLLRSLVADGFLTPAEGAALSVEVDVEVRDLESLRTLP